MAWPGWWCTIAVTVYDTGVCTGVCRSGWPCRGGGVRGEDERRHRQRSELRLGAVAGGGGRGTCSHSGRRLLRVWHLPGKHVRGLCG